MQFLLHVIGAVLLWVSLARCQESPNLSVYGDVPGLSPSPYYSFRVREQSSGEWQDWMDTFALVTECTTEKYCNTTGYYDKGPYINDVSEIFGILDPLPPLVSTKFTQPSFLWSEIGYPPPPSLY